MPRSLRQVTAVAFILAVLVSGGCSSAAPEEPSDPPDSPSSEPFTLPAPSEPPMPPMPTTACLPATPVQLELGPNLLGCALTPTSWTITNTSRTVVHLTAGIGSRFPMVTVRPTPPGNPRAGVSELLSGVYALYRSQDQGLWLEPDGVVDITWPGDTPGTLKYQAAPSDSAAISAATALAESALEERGHSGAVSADDILSCYTGVRDMASAVSKGQYAPTADTWNTVIDDGLTARTCFNLVPKESRDKLKTILVKAGSETLSELEPIWHRLFSIRLP